jgi:Leucine-rich repeat (LRR) protein
MKSVIIGVLIAALAVLGLVYLSQDSVPKTGTTENQGSVGTTGSAVSGEKLDLSGKDLDKISDDTFSKSSVTVLDVSSNNLTGSLPAEIRKLTELEVLIAANNNMTGIPAEIGRLSKLRIVDFSNNNISGLPSEIGRLKELETLDLRGNPKASQRDIGQIQSQLPNVKILTD